MSSDRIKSSQYVEWARARVKPQQTPSLLTRRAMAGRYVRYSYRFHSWQFQDAVTRDWRNIPKQLKDCLLAAGYGTQPPMGYPEQLEMFE